MAVWGVSGGGVTSGLVGGYGAAVVRPVPKVLMKGPCVSVVGLLLAVTSLKLVRTRHLKVLLHRLIVVRVTVSVLVRVVLGNRLQSCCVIVRVVR